jgi:hypothetical protein
VNRAEAFVDADEFDGGSGRRRRTRHLLILTTIREPDTDSRRPDGDDRA